MQNLSSILKWISAEQITKACTRLLVWLQSSKSTFKKNKETKCKYTKYKTIPLKRNIG